MKDFIYFLLTFCSVAQRT